MFRRTKKNQMKEPCPGFILLFQVASLSVMAKETLSGRVTSQGDRSVLSDVFVLIKGVRPTLQQVQTEVPPSVFEAIVQCLLYSLLVSQSVKCGWHPVERQALF